MVFGNATCENMLIPALNFQGSKTSVRCASGFHVLINSVYMMSGQSTFMLDTIAILMGNQVLFEDFFRA